MVQKARIINQQLSDDAFSDEVISLKAKVPVLVGNGALVKVNTGVGISTESNIQTEYKKAELLCSLPYRPDIISDLSIMPVQEPLYRFLLKNFDGAVGVIPYYTLFSVKHGLVKNEVVVTIQMLLEEGVSFMTLHLTANLNLYNLAVQNKSNIACTSRGGYCLLRDAKINNRHSNIIVDNFDIILKLFKKHKAVISIGSVFRPATIWDALDEVQLQEIDLQKKFISQCDQAGVKVILEGLGHASLNGINEYLKIISKIKVPLMPLGPVPSDELIGFDHIGNALGALTMAKSPWLSIINCLTRREHLGGVPTIHETLEALKTARATAHVINCSRSESYMRTMETTWKKRRVSQSCVVSGGLFGEAANGSCDRCGRECPFNVNNNR